MLLRTIWAVLATMVAFALAILHFANPYPLIQIPDRGHRIFFVPEKLRTPILDVLATGGLHVVGSYRSAVNQTLMDDGFTVIATGVNPPKAAIVLPSDDPQRSADKALIYLTGRGITATTWTSPEEELKGKLVVVRLPEDVGWNLAFRLPGYRMPTPKWKQE